MMGDIAGRFTSDVTARLPSAAHAVVSVQLDCDCDFLHLRRVNWSVTCFKKTIYSCVVRRNLQFDSRSLRFRSYGDPAARLVPFQPMAHGFTL